MKGIKKLILPLILLAVAIAAYFAATTIAKKAEANENEEIDKTVSILQLESNIINCVEFHSNTGVLSIEVSGEKYYLKDDHDFPMNQTVAKALVNAVTNIEGVNLSAPSDDLSEYGLSNPEKEIRIKLNNGAESGIKIGNYNKYSSLYYCMLDGDSKIYCIDSDLADYFGYTLDDMIVHEIITKPDDGINDVTTITLTRYDGEIIEYRFVEEIPAVYKNDDEIEKEAIEAHWNKFDGNGNLLAEYADEEASAAYEEIVGCDLSEWESYNTTDEKKSEVGLLPPQYTAVIKYTEEVTSTADDSTSSITKTVEKTIKLNIGYIIESDDQEVANSRYIMIDGGKILYTLSENELVALTF